MSSVNENTLVSLFVIIRKYTEKGIDVLFDWYMKKKQNV